MWKPCECQPVLKIQEKQHANGRQGVTLLTDRIKNMTMPTITGPPRLFRVPDNNNSEAMIADRISNGKPRSRQC